MIGFLALLLLLLLLLQAVEIWRRFRFPQALTVAQFRRRLVTAAILEIALMMWLLGDLLIRHQPPLTQLAYWSAVLLLVLAAAAAAVREMGEVTRQYHRQRAELYRGTREDEGVKGRRGDEVTERGGEGATGGPAGRVPEP